MLIDSYEHLRKTRPYPCYDAHTLLYTTHSMWIFLVSVDARLQGYLCFCLGMPYWLEWRTFLTSASWWWCWSKREIPCWWRKQHRTLKTVLWLWSWKKEAGGSTCQEWQQLHCLSVHYKLYWALDCEDSRQWSGLTWLGLGERGMGNIYLIVRWG